MRIVMGFFALLCTCCTSAGAQEFQYPGSNAYGTSTVICPLGTTTEFVFDGYSWQQTGYCSLPTQYGQTPRPREYYNAPQQYFPQQYIQVPSYSPPGFTGPAIGTHPTSPPGFTGPAIGNRVTSPPGFTGNR